MSPPIVVQARDGSHGHLFTASVPTQLDGQATLGPIEAVSRLIATTLSILFKIHLDIESVDLYLPCYLTIQSLSIELR